MTIKPIDLQTHIAQIHEVAKGEQGRSAAVIEGQHVLEKVTSEESKLISERLDENKKGEKTAIKKEEDRKKKRARFAGKKDRGEEQEEANEVVKDERMGRMIDVKR